MERIEKEHKRFILLEICLASVRAATFAQGWFILAIKARVQQSIFSYNYEGWLCIAKSKPKILKISKKLSWKREEI